MKVTPLSLSSDTLEFLAEMAQEATDSSGRTISHSAVARATLRLAKGQEQAILAQVESELNAGIKWGHAVGWKTPKRGRKQGKEHAKQ